MRPSVIPDKRDKDEEKKTEQHETRRSDVFNPFQTNKMIMTRVTMIVE